MNTWFLFILLFGVVVFIHELGHFLVAKRSGIFVERFALGFGPALIKKKFGETEYAICLFPLGGYVKMRGEEPDESTQGTPDPRAFDQASPFTRIAVAAMGPTSNLLLPIFIFTGIYVAGMPTLTSDIGSIAPGSAAQEAGLHPGDQVVSIEGKPVWKWAELEEAFRRGAGKKMAISVQREGGRKEFSITPREEIEPNLFGEKKPVGKVGVSPQPFRPVVGVMGPSTPAYQAGLRSGDVITSVNGRKVQYWWELQEATSAKGDHWTFEIDRLKSIEKPTDFQKISVELKKSFSSLAALGIEEGELYLRDVREGSVASSIGLKPGDKLVSLNQAPIASWADFQVKIRDNTGDKIVLGFMRDGKLQIAHFIPAEIEDRNEVTKEKEKRRQLGVVSSAIPGDVKQKDERFLNPFKAVGRAFEETVEITSMTVAGLFKLFTGKLAVKKSLGGPISIFYLAGSSYEAGGWVSFFRMMALLSVTLGVINLLPIPILDGGHILFFVIEAIKGSPLSIRVRDISQQVGLYLVGALMLLTFYVDIERYFLDRFLSLFK